MNREWSCSAQVQKWKGKQLKHVSKQYVGIIPKGLKGTKNSFKEDSWCHVEFLDWVTIFLCTDWLNLWEKLNSHFLIYFNFLMLRIPLWFEYSTVCDVSDFFYVCCSLLFWISFTWIFYTKFETEDIRRENKIIISITTLQFINKFSKELFLYYQTTVVAVAVNWESNLQELCCCPQFPSRIEQSMKQRTKPARLLANWV